MHILIVTNSFIKEISFLIRYARRIDPSLQFSVIIPSNASYDQLSSASVLRRTLLSPRHIRAACYSPALFADIRRCRPDILHVFEEYSGLIAFQSVLSRNVFCRKSKIMVYSAENIIGNVNPIFRLFMNYVKKYANLAFVCSQGVKHTLQAEGFAHPIEVFPLGVDTSIFHKMHVNELKVQLRLDGKFILGYIGRLLECKGIFLLLEAMRALPEHVHLLIVGIGPQEERLRQRIAQDRLEERVHLLGNIPYHQLPRYMNCLDIGIVPSQTTARWKEQYGRVLVELMSCEVPVIGSDSGSIPEVLGDVGIIFRENDHQELVQKITQYMVSPDKRRELGKSGRQRVQAFYSTQVMGQKVLSMYAMLKPINGEEQR